ncbi:BtuB Outer membrane cobalamin receptor protein [Paracoccaceae bacterium]
MKRLNVSIVALVSALAVPAQAQDFELDEIVVTANRTATKASRTGVSVSVVAKAELDRSGVAVVETLARQPGFSTATQGPFGNTANLNLRGAQGRYVAVFVDGIRVDDPSSTTTSYEFGGLMSSGIGRLEVLRGSQSALWGGSAVAGVVSIDSPRATEEGTEQTVELEAGSMGTAKLSYGLSQKTGALGLTLNASHLQTDGFSAAAAGTEADGASAQRLSFGLRYAVNDALTLGANAFGQTVDQDYDGFAGVPADAANNQKRDEIGGRVFAELSIGATDHVFSLSTFKIGRDFYARGVADGSFEGTRQRLDWTATTEVSPALTLVYGADLTREGATVNSVVPVTFLTSTVIETTTTKGVFAQGLWAVRDDLDLSATLRWDDTDSFGGFTTGRVAMALRPATDLTLRAAYATGFRAPSLNELYADYSAYGYANNPALQPETSTSAEIGLEKAFGNGATLSATLFKLEIDNRIDNRITNRCAVAVPDGDPCPSFIYILDNFSGTSQRKGLEVAASLPLGDTIDLSLAYAYIDAKTADNTPINGVARHNLTVGLDKEFTDRLSANATLRHVAGRTDLFSGAAMADYTTVDLGGSYKVSDTASAYLRVQNAFDTNYQEAKDYATAGRTVFLGLKASF